MKQIHWYEKILISLMTLFLIIITVWLTVVPITKSKAFYMRQYEKNNTQAETGYSKEDLEIITDQIIGYLFEKEESMQVKIDGQEVFSKQALIHMEDVRTLYIGGQKIAWGILVLFLLCVGYIVFHFSRLKHFLLRYSIVLILILLVIVVAIGIFAWIDFDKAFEFFHRVIFPSEQKFNDAFFAPESNYPDEIPGVNNLMLITILSIELFMQVGLTIFIVLMAVLAMWFGGLITIHRLNKKQEKKIS